MSESARPEVGDLVKKAGTPGDGTHVVSNISDARTDSPIWELRKRYGASMGPGEEVGVEAIDTWEITARRGQWKDPAGSVDVPRRAQRP